MRRTRSSREALLAGAVAAPWILWAFVRVLGLDVRYPLVAAIAFTPYVAATGPVPVVAALLLRRWAVAAAAAVAAVALLAVVLPRALADDHRASAGDRGPRLVVMTLNTFGGQADARTVMRLVREHRVDVLSLQELTPEAVRRLDLAGARELLPGRAVDARPGPAGSGLMARLPLRPVAARHPSTPAQPEAALSVRGAPALRVKAVHPLPPISRPDELDWRAKLRALPPPRQGDALRMLLGDFNGTLDHREIRRLLDRGYFDAADATGDGLRATWPVGRRRPALTLDHVLLPPLVKVRRVTIHEVPGSDHRAVIAELVLPRA